MDIAGFEAEKLYLKLDKRLLLRADRVVLPRSRAEMSPETLQRSLKRLHRVLEFFDSIELDRVEFRNGTYRLIYRDNILYVKSPDFEVAGMVYNRGDRMEVQFPLVRIPRHDITLSGELFYRYADGRIDADGFYQVPDLAGEFRLEKKGERIRFHLDSMNTGSLKRLMKLFSMSREAKEWLSRRISAKSYRLEYLEGEGRYDDASGEFRPDLDTLRGAVILKRIRIRFHDKLRPLTAPSARVVMRHSNLYFLLEKPRYGNHRLQGSHAALLHLNDPRRLTLLLRLYTKGRLDWKVLEILHAYGIKINLGQKSGSSESRVDIDIPLGGEGRTKIRGITRFGKGILESGKRTVRIDGGELAYTSRIAVLRNFRIDEPSFKGTLEGRIDLKKRSASLDAKVRSFVYRAGGEELLALRDTTVPLKLRWDEEGVSVDLPRSDTSVRIGKQGDYRLLIRRLEAWKPYLRGPLSLLEGGKVEAKGDAKGELTVEGVLRWPDAPFYTRDGPVVRYPFTLRSVGHALKFDALGGKIAFRSDQKVLHIQSVNVDARRLIRTIRKLRKKGNGRQSSPPLYLTVLGKKSIIRYGRYVLLSDTYRLDIRKNRLRFEGNLGKDRVQLVKEGDFLRLDAKRIGDRMLHSLIHFNGLQDGQYTLHLEGTGAKGYTGEILIDGGVLRDVKAYNDLIALFNTVPALVSFSNPGFSAKGFEIKKGRILFTLKGDLLNLESILLEGRSSTVAGKGTVDLATKALDIQLAIRTAREMGRTLGQIPLVGYILFGKDKSLTAGVKISGTLEKPVVRTNPVGEALLYPLELLRRTLMAPGELGRDDELPEEAYSPDTPATKMEKRKAPGKTKRKTAPTEKEGKKEENVF
jgi:hypothetical protein